MGFVRNDKARRGNARHTWVVALGTALALGLWLSPGCRCDRERSEADAPPPTTSVGAEVEAPETPPVEDVAPETATPAAPLVEWRFTPSYLDVYRDTTVRFRAEATEDGGAPLRYEWDFGDGAPSSTGDDVEHTYRGGRSDQMVTLRAFDGDKLVYEATRPLRLERLPVTAVNEDAPIDASVDLSIPAPPPKGDTSFRLAVISDSNARYGSIDQGAHVDAAVASLIGAVDPDLVIHNGDMIAGQSRELDVPRLEKMWGAYHAAVTDPLLQAGIPLAPVPGNHDAAPGFPDREVYRQTWTRPAYWPRVTFVDKADYPYQYSFTHNGAFFVVLDAPTGKVDESLLRWLRRQLAHASIYTVRFVFLHVPLQKFTDVRYGDVNQPEEAHDPLRTPAGEDHIDSPGLQKHFRVYNTLLEYNVTALFSGHYEVYFKGRYGALRVVSTGNIAGTRRALSGQSEGQGSSFVVVDVEDGQLKRVFAVRGPDFEQRFDEHELPDQVENYRYDPAFTPGLTFEGGGGSAPE